MSSSIQSAGVGGTGPSVEMGGRRVGGDTTLSDVRVMLWDRGAGGGPGGGGGRGIPGSHLATDDDRDLAEDGVLVAPAETALREAGGLASKVSMATEDTDSVEMCNGRRGTARSRGNSGETVRASGVGAFLVNDERLNKACGLSLDEARDRLLGGGGKI